MEGQYTTPQDTATLVAVVLNSFVESGDQQGLNFFIGVLEKAIALSRERMAATVNLN